MADGDVKPEVQPDGSQAVRFTETIVDAKDAIAKEAEAATAESLGIDQASFDKYVKDGVMDWASYGKEQAFKAAQKPAEEAPAEPKAGEGEAAAADAEKAANAQDLAEKAGIEWEQAAASIVESGDISEADRKALTDMGLPEFVIDDYIEAVKRDADGYISTVMDAFGGEAQFEQVFNAVTEKATDEDRTRIDDLLRDPKTFQFGVQLAYETAGIQAPAPGTQPATAPAPAVPAGGAVNAAPGDAGVTGFADFNEMVAAQRDPKYKTDPEYRAQFMKRARASNIDMNPRLHTSGL
jgi:hypothetical protein